MTAKPADEPGLWLRAGPTGKRSGFVALADGSGGTVTVTILPKMWTAAPMSVRRLRCQAGATTHVAAHETDYIHLTGPPELLGAIALSLSRISGTGQAELLVPGRPPAQEPNVAAAISHPFGCLIDLMLLAEKAGIDTSETPYDGRLAESLMRLIAQERLLREVEPLLFRARPSYSEHTGTLSQPRGRLHDRSLLLASATRQPWVDCTYDELTMDTSLLRVVKSSLHVIATDRLPPRIAALMPRAQTRAVQFIRHLATVQLISRDSAALQADRLWLGPLERNWDPVLQAARHVLRQIGPVPEGEPAESADSIAVHVLTERFWEQALETILRAAFGDVRTSADGSLGTGVTVTPPWTPAGRTAVAHAYPDYMFRNGARLVLADAKYKPDATLGASDAYQLFAYSHLASLEASSSDMSLVLYPAAPRSEPHQRQWTRLPDGQYPLWTVSLPFPSRTDVRNQAAWNQYISRGAFALRALATEWAAPAP